MDGPVYCMGMTANIALWYMLVRANAAMRYCILFFIFSRKLIREAYDTQSLRAKVKHALV